MSSCMEILFDIDSLFQILAMLIQLILPGGGGDGKDGGISDISIMNCKHRKK